MKYFIDFEANSPSNEIIEMHNGTIKYLSTKDIGTTVSIKLPYK